MYSKSEVDYSEGTKQEHCGNCRHFEVVKEHGCEIVRGTIEAEYWCNQWDKMKQESARDTIQKSIYSLKEESLEEHELDDIGERNIDGQEEGHWGYHLLLDLNDCNDKIDSEQDIEEFIVKLVEELEMEPLGKPTVIRVDSEKEGRGISAFQMITTSHIAAHFDDQGMNGYLDVFSCKQFDPQLAIDLINETFEPQKMGKFWMFRDAGSTDPD